MKWWVCRACGHALKPHEPKYDVIVKRALDSEGASRRTHAATGARFRPNVVLSEGTALDHGRPNKRLLYCPKIAGASVSAGETTATLYVVVITSSSPRK